MTNKLLPFTKMHGLGNDFIIIDAISNTIDARQLPIAQLANRHTGIGCDQVLLIEKSSKADFFCRIFNADGSEAEQCGNGLRCVARFVQENGLASAPSLRIETKAGVFPVTIKDYDHIQLQMGLPQQEESPSILLSLFDTHSLLKDNATWETILGNTEKELTIPITAINLGNPHAIIKVSTVDAICTERFGAEISTHPYFPNGANVGFMQVLNPSHIHLRTFERGVGETHACGSNACAAVAAGILNGWLNHEVTVSYRYGDLKVEWLNQQTPILLTGSASRVFSGVV